jgi:predicted helicase
MDWEKFAIKTFYPTIEKVECFDDFVDNIFETDNCTKVKGDHGEYFCKLFFETQLIYDVKHYWALSEVPENILKKLNLESEDYGIDGVVENNDGTYSSVQVKFRANKNIIIPWGEMATFEGLTFGGSTTGFKTGIFITNCCDVCDKLKNTNYQNITYDVLKKSCDKTFWDICRQKIKNKPTKKIEPKYPHKYQEKILSKMMLYFKHKCNGKLFMPCGTGKTLMAYWFWLISNFCNVFIVVPSSAYETWKIENKTRNVDCDYLFIASDVDVNDPTIQQKNICPYTITTNKNVIKKFLSNISSKKIVIVTYQSSLLLIECCKELNFEFDLGVFDEAHRTVGIRGSEFTKLATSKKICFNKLFMTATEKNKKCHKIMKDNDIVSMDDETIYGETICSYSTRKAISNGQLCNYIVIGAFANNDTVREIKNKYVICDKSIVTIHQLSIVYMIIDAIKNQGSTHILLFSNRNKYAKQLCELIKKIIFS